MRCAAARLAGLHERQHLLAFLSRRPQCTVRALSPTTKPMALKTLMIRLNEGTQKAMLM